MFKDKIKKLDMHDIALIKLAMIAFAFLLITIPSPESNFIMAWVHTVHWGWFLAAVIILAIRPQMRVWGK